jgi:hypothetical protein
MSYSSGGLIQATDYNGFVGSDPSTTSGQLNAVWGTGNGQYGYGQTPVSQAASGGVVTAAQWASLINALNSTLTHQTDTVSGISAPTSGQLIAYLSSLTTNLSTIYTNHLAHGTNGSTASQSTISPNFTSVNTGSAESFTITRTATFNSGDAARYFFNAGGYINFIFGTATYADGTARSSDLVTLINTNYTSMTGFAATANGQRTGSGGTLSGSYTSGYYGLSTSAQTIATVTSSTSGYSSDTVSMTVATNTTNSSGHADLGYVLTFTFTITSAARTDATLGSYFNDTINITVPHYLQVVYPESTDLTASWGTVTLA